MYMHVCAPHSLFTPASLNFIASLPMPTGLHNFALPDLKWTRTKLSKPSLEPESDDPNQEPAQQKQQANAVVAVEVDESSGKSWNLRPRKPVSAKSPVNLDVGVPKHVRREKKKKKLSISLTKDEIEEDLYSMTGTLPSKRPKKRNRAVQKLVDKVFPGSRLAGTSADSYRLQHFSQKRGF
ncbi:uncharacterized protein LOC141664442 [Apium graveolens]|uniref:uncharacterized protein LOC141664442 n=1 Tax=Apium graveolens TaxID=4045 RepID=UPI003D7AD63E